MGDSTSPANSPSTGGGHFTQNAVAGPSQPRRSHPSSPPLSDGQPPRKRPRGRPPAPKRNELYVQKAHFKNNEGIYWYHYDLKRHRLLTYRHLNGVMERTAMQGGPDLPLHATDEDVKVDVIADARWASDEKERFFAALTRHSRLRPDLIAKDIGTKTEVDVWRYIWSLECYLPRVYRKKGSMAEHRDWIDRMLWNGAYEVPDDVVDAEERLAPIMEQVEWSEGQRRKRPDKPATFPELEGRPTRPVSEANTATIEAWGKELTLAKMDNVADVVYLDEFQTLDGDGDGRECDEDHEGKTEAETYARDDEMIASLRAIPKKQRSLEQRSTLLTMENRRRIRQNYRRKQLRAQGKTDKEIDSAGGPDVLWVGKRNAGRKRKSKAELLSESHPEVAHLRSLGAAGYLENRGWELFNFDRMPQLIELYKSAHGIKPLPHETESATSFEVLSPLYESVRNFVANLMHQASIIATTHDPTTNEVREEHVGAAIQDRSDYMDSTEALRPIWRRLTHLAAIAHERELAGAGEQAAAARQMPVGSGENRYHDESQTDRSRAEDGEADNESDDDNEEAANRRWYGRRRLNRQTTQNVPPQLLFADPPSDEDVWMVQGTRTDEEDEELEDALGAVDDALDEIMGVQVRSAADSMEKGLVLDDHAWVNNMGIRGRKWKDHRAAVPVPQAAQGRLLRAQDVYHDLAEEITAQRRKRREMAERGNRFNRTRRAVEAGHHRRYPPVPAHIIAMESMMDRDSDSDNNNDMDVDEGGPTASRRMRVLLSEDSTRDTSPRKFASSDLEEERDEWVASGESSGALTTDEEDNVGLDESVNPTLDEDASSDEEDGRPTTAMRNLKSPYPASKPLTTTTGRPPRSPVAWESEADDAGMDIGGEVGLDDVSMEEAKPAILGGDDALDSDSEADVAPLSEDGARASDAEEDRDDELNLKVEEEVDELDSDSEKDEIESSPPSEKDAFDQVGGDQSLDLGMDAPTSSLGGDDQLDPDSYAGEEPKRRSPTWAVAPMSDDKSTGLVGGDEALDSESEDELDTNSDSGLVGGDEESEDERNASGRGFILMGGDEALDSDSEVEPDDVGGRSVLFGGDEALNSVTGDESAIITDAAGPIGGDYALDSDSEPSIARTEPNSARGLSPERLAILSPSPSHASVVSQPSSIPAPIISLAISQGHRTRTSSPSASDDSDADGYDSDLGHHTVRATHERSESGSTTKDDGSDEDDESDEDHENDAKLEVLQPAFAAASEYSDESVGAAEGVELLGGDDALDSDSD